MELPDFLTLRATGHPARCLNSLACKWTYNPEATGFSDPFWRQIGMSDVVEQRYGPFIGQERILAPGEPVGDGLTDNAAKELGLDGGKGLKVGAAIIDAYAVSGKDGRHLILTDRFSGGDWVSLRSLRWQDPSLISRKVAR